MRTRDLDSLENLRHDYRAIRGKPFLKRLYTDFYTQIKAALPAGLAGPVVEIGAGAGFMRELYPGLVTADILPSRFIDLCCDARRLPFAPGSLRGIVMLNVFHHIPSPSAFMSDAAVCLKPGGVIVMVEPWVTAWSLAVYRLLHHEKTDPSQNGWEFVSTGPMSGANQALPWIVFARDRRRFEESFPELAIEKIALHTPLAYLLSGGVGRPQTLPCSWYPAVRRLEKSLAPLLPRMAMFATLVLTRR